MTAVPQGCMRSGVSGSDSDRKSSLAVDIIGSM